MLDSFYVIPGYTFFYWGFTFPKKHYNDFIDYFDFKEGNLVENITIKIKNRKYDAKIRMARIDNTGKFKVVQIENILREMLFKCFMIESMIHLKPLGSYLFIVTHLQQINRNHN